MAGKIKESMSARYELLSNTIKSLEKKIRTFPEGSLKIKKTKNHVYYYFSKYKEPDKYLTSKDSELIQKLIQKSYLQYVLKAAKAEAEAISKNFTSYPEEIMEDVYDNLSDERREHAKPLVPGDEEYARKWMEIPYKHKGFKKDSSEFYTLKGERVRSKSEVIIADRLNAKGIPYKYECPLKIGNETIHPDFTILKMSNKKVVYYEHCGKMDDPEYTKEMSERSHLYTSAKIFQGDRLFYTFETSDDPLDIKMLDEFIENGFR